MRTYEQQQAFAAHKSGLSAQQWVLLRIHAQQTLSASCQVDRRARVTARVTARVGASPATRHLEPDTRYKGTTTKRTHREISAQLHAVSRTHLLWTDAPGTYPK